MTGLEICRGSTAVYRLELGHCFRKLFIPTVEPIALTWLSYMHPENTMRNMMSTVQVIAFALNYSAKRLLNFQDNLENDPVSREEMEKRTKLQSLCETRWAARADALHTFQCAYRYLHEYHDYGVWDYVQL
ncbi:hypothetical protein DPMN_150483 [Dreissena polymorpha]|uniref:Uncharacterized protein n=1 Tax=Dreissena polymorpha TaxID=45954 RepID=A0A9D4FFG6_DREPO|nr:hypothetical protein DPMN_150483 [Dreissena polymorpha]